MVTFIPNFLHPLDSYSSLFLGIAYIFNHSPKHGTMLLSLILITMIKYSYWAFTAPLHQIHQFSSVQSLSRVQLFETPWTAACRASLSIINSRSLLNLCPLSQWCHPTISSSVVTFSSHLQSFPASGSFKMSQFFPSGGQSIGVSASTSVLPMNIEDDLL